MGKDRPHVSYLHPGQWPVHIGFTTDPHQFDREMKRLKVDNPTRFIKGDRSAATTHIFVKDGTLCFIITTVAYSKRRTREQYAALIAHEAIHVIQEMRRELASGACFDDESEAYLLQYIVQHCLQCAWGSRHTRNTEPV
jgi:hypothetical protein